MQVAPFDDAYDFPLVSPATQIYDTGKTVMNTYKGGIWQQALSALTALSPASYQGTQGLFSTYGFEYWPSRGSDGYITWAVDGQRAWTLTNAALAANPRVEIGPRLIPEEPMVRPHCRPCISLTVCYSTWSSTLACHLVSKTRTSSISCSRTRCSSTMSASTNAMDRRTGAATQAIIQQPNTSKSASPSPSQALHTYH